MPPLTETTNCDARSSLRRIQSPIASRLDVGCRVSRDTTTKTHVVRVAVERASVQHDRSTARESGIKRAVDLVLPAMRRNGETVVRNAHDEGLGVHV